MVLCSVRKLKHNKLRKTNNDEKNNKKHKKTKNKNTPCFNEGTDDGYGSEEVDRTEED